MRKAAAGVGRDTAVVLDACVLIPMPLADTLLRLGSGARLYAPKWSEPILEETERNLLEKFGLTPEQVGHRMGQMRRHFPEAMISGFLHRIPHMPNHWKDRHVLAAAVHARAPLILTYNVRDFPRTMLAPLGVVAIGPDAFLCRLYEREAKGVQELLVRQSAAIGMPVDYVLQRLAVNVPGFVAAVRGDSAIH